MGIIKIQKEARMTRYDIALKKPFPKEKEKDAEPCELDPNCVCPGIENCSLECPKKHGLNREEAREFMSKLIRDYRTQLDLRGQQEERQIISDHNLLNLNDPHTTFAVRTRYQDNFS
jgi:hypothetical protein